MSDIVKETQGRSVTSSNAIRLLCRIFLMWGILASVQAEAQTPSLYGKSYGLVVGIDQYANPEVWPTLSFPKKDAEAMAKVLREQGFDEVVELYDSEATRIAVLAALEDRIAPKLQAEDRIVIFFSGHGATRRFGDREYGYIVPHGGTHQSATWLSMRELREVSRKLGSAKHQLFILDSCFGGSFAVKSGSSTISRNHPNYIREITQRKARQYLTAGGRDQEVRDSGPHGYSYFTGYLLEALQEGWADTDGDGYITAIELAQYLQSRATDDNQTPGFGDLPGHQLGDFLFVSPTRRQVLPKAPELNSAAAILGLKAGLEITPVEERRELQVDVKVREAPTVAAPAIGQISQGIWVWVAGQVKDQDWLLVEHDDLRGYIVRKAAEIDPELLEILGPEPTTAVLPSPCTRAEDCYQRGQFATDAGDLEAAAIYAYRACKWGMPSGCAVLGYHYFEGKGVPENQQRARILLERACEAGNLEACLDLAHRYYEGQGLARNYHRARELFTKACDADHMGGCFLLGLMVSEGEGGKRDRRQARELYSKACALGDNAGCNNLGILYLRGKGGVRDYDRANELFKKSCDGGNSLACANLASSYERGLGMPRDLQYAAELYEQACEGDYDKACQWLKNLEN